jgi:hypothetical protein
LFTFASSTHPLYHLLSTTQASGNLQVKDEILRENDLGLDPCRMTWTIPYDCVSGFWFLATAYYLSSVVQEFWSGVLKGPIVWHVTTLTAVTSACEYLSEFVDLSEDEAKSELIAG